MAQFKVSASVTSPPFTVALSVGGNKIKMARDSSGAWAGSSKNPLNLPDPVLIQFGATGISGSPWTLKVDFTPTNGASQKTFTHSDKIGDNGASALSAQEKLS